MGIGFGLLAALGFGIADFLATLSARRLGVLRSLLFVQLFGLSALAIVAIVSRTGPPAFSSAWLVE